MKSIKEKAEEHSLEPRANSHCGYDEEDLGDSFEAGANYVLKEIETIAKADLGSYKSQLDRIKELIEQLKK